jgi:hypothetical protein
MKNINMISRQFLLIIISLLLSGTLQTNYAQKIKWLHVTDLQSPISETGAEVESQFPSLQNGNHFSWPAQYGLEQNVMRAQGFWIGCKNFDDPVEGKVKTVKVIGSGPRSGPDRVNQIFPIELKLIAKRNHPAVFVDNNAATVNDSYDIPDEIDPDLPCDRMVVIKFHTSMGVTVTKKVMVFDSPNHGNYYIHDYVFKNTGIYNAAGNVKVQTLQDVFFYWVYRWAFAGESVSGFSSTWGAFASAWGNSTLNHHFGSNPAAPEFNDPSSPLYQLRGYYAYYGPSKDRSVSYDEDWGCPNEDEDGRLGSPQYGGCVTLHADKSATDKSDNIYQPRTTWFIGSDINAMQANSSQYDEIFMDDRYTIMSEGHPDKSHDEYVGEDYAINYADPRRQAGGGTSQGQGYGPYTLAPGDSIHIVFAIGVSGLSREKNLEVGKNWLQWYKNTGQPELIRPDGSTTTDHNLYKREWVQTGKDSILKTLRNALNNFKSNYTLPMPPPPPNNFIVNSGGNKIILSWSNDAESSPHFGGYIVYRTVGNVLDPLTHYEKIWECDKSNLTNTFEDRTPHRGFDYYYAVQSKDDGTQNEVEPGVPLYSNLVWTISSVPATLQREAVPEGTLPFDFTTTKWKRINPKGEWSADSTYYNNENESDAVTYFGTTYVCIVDNIKNDSFTDSLESWKPILYTGEWVSGKEYKAYNSVTMNGIDYYTPYSISGGQGLELVRVVPNPYDKRSRLFQFGEESQYDRITFYGLPAECKLMIFTESGEMIWEKEHKTGTGDELWDSKTSSGQIVASGIYILYVETPKGESVIRKFVIIR